MQQRFALLIRRTKTSSPNEEIVKTIHDTVHAADAPEACYFTSLHRLTQWFEDVLPSHALSHAIPFVGEPNK